MAHNTSLIYGIIGAFLCLFGWNLYRVGMWGVGVLSGLILGVAIGLGIFSTSPVRLEPYFWAIIAISVILSLGLTISFLKTLKIIIIFPVGFALAVAIAHIILTDANPFFLEVLFKNIVHSFTMQYLIIGVIGGALCLIFFKYFVIILTSAFGAALIGLALEESKIFLIGVFIVGMIFQTILAGKKRKFWVT